MCHHNDITDDTLRQHLLSWRMARWDPGAEDRLKQAALELFSEHGYENVTVTQIAERAGLTRRSFFRYFPDKREVLFRGSEQLPPAIAAAILAANASDPPLTVVLDSLTKVGEFLTHQVKHAAARQTVINASTELKERERTKLATLTVAICEALEQRAVEPGVARMVAEVSTIVFRNAFELWAANRGKQRFGRCLAAVAISLKEAVTAATTDNS